MRRSASGDLGSVMASFNVEDFSLNRMKRLKHSEIKGTLSPSSRPDSLNTTIHLRWDRPVVFDSCYFLSRNVRVAW
jgi:hypothetical protein